MPLINGNLRRVLAFHVDFNYLPSVRSVRSVNRLKFLQSGCSEAFEFNVLFTAAPLGFNQCSIQGKVSPVSGSLIRSDLA